MFTFKIDGITKDKVINETPGKFKNVKMFACDANYTGASGRIRNLIVRTETTPGTTPMTA